MTSSLILSSVMLLAACQPKDKGGDSEKNQASAQVVNQQSSDQLLVESKTVVLQPKHAQICEDEGCTAYEFQTVETNFPWINTYFKDRIIKANPLPFEEKASQAAASEAQTDGVGQSSTTIRFVGQNQHLATFEIMTYIYAAGAAHGMYHKEYVNFDLKQKKRITVPDLMANKDENKLLDALFEENGQWLSAHSIERSKLQLSDNFYYGVNGIVFVYPLYELASYAEGMSELVLSYYAVNGLIKPEYLPNLPKYK